MVHNEKIMGMEAGLKEEFGEDYAIVCSRFWLQKANLSFMTGKLEDAKNSAEKGLELVK